MNASFNKVTEEIRKLNIQMKQLKRKKEDYENRLKQRKTEEKEEKRKCLKNKLTAQLKFMNELD